MSRDFPVPPLKRAYSQDFSAWGRPVIGYWFEMDHSHEGHRLFSDTMDIYLNQYNWHNSYINPYDPTSTFDQILKTNGFTTVRPDSWHFGPDAHCFWGSFLLQYCIEHNLVQQ